MDDFRSRSYVDGRDRGPPVASGMQDLRCYSASYASSSSSQQPTKRDVEFKRGKSTSGSSSKKWSLSDAEMQRKKRVASYKVYAVEGKMKGSLRKSFRWIKDRCTQVVYGWR